MPDANSSLSVYFSGGITLADSQSVYVKGQTPGAGNVPAYTKGLVSYVSSSIYAYLEGQVTTTQPAYLEGTSPGDPGGNPVAVDHIWLKNSDLSLQKKFRVVAQGYDDGVLEKAESLDRTIGGGIDHSVGAVYRQWNPTIKVRHTESETDYGDLDDLETFYNLVNPGGTATNVITFIDHHQATNTVYMVGTFRKQYLGTAIEGANAWLLVRLRLQEVQ